MGDGEEGRCMHAAHLVRRFGRALLLTMANPPAAMVAARNIVALAAGKELTRYPEGLYGGTSTLPFCGGTSLGAKAGVFQMGDDVQVGAGPAKIKGFITWMIVKAASGSWFGSWLYYSIKSVMAGQLTKAAKKASAAAK